MIAMISREEALELARKYTSAKRFEHVLRVEEMAIYLAKFHNVDVEKVRLAALLHDIGYEINPELSKEDKAKYHDSLAYEFLKGKVDDDIRLAIKYHKEANKKMDSLAKVIYLADKLERGRVYEQRESLEKIAIKNLDYAMIKTIENSISYLKSHNIEISKNTVETLNYLKENNMFDLEDFKYFLDQKHAKDIEILDLKGKSSEVDFMVVVTAINKPHLKALSDHITEYFYERGFELKNSEGKQESGWILLDFADFFVHIFDGEMRNYYEIEKLWQSHC